LETRSRTASRHAHHGPGHVRGDGGPLANLDRRVNSLDDAKWAKSSIARGDLATEISALRGESGGEIIAWGGASFAQALSRNGLIDEYVLVIHPVALGSGLPMFRDLPKALVLELIEARTYDNSTVLHVYRRKD
jgi:dihydrofolate reductase